MENPIVIKFFYLFLLNRNITNKDWIASRPQTELYRDLKQLNVNPLITFMKNYCDKKIIHNEIECRSQELYEKYVEWLGKNGYKVEITSNGFGMTMKNIFKIPKEDVPIMDCKTGITKRRIKSGTIFIFNPSNLLKYINSKF